MCLSELSPVMLLYTLPRLHHWPCHTATCRAFSALLFLSSGLTLPTGHYPSFQNPPDQPPLVFFFSLSKGNPVLISMFFRGNFHSWLLEVPVGTPFLGKQIELRVQDAGLQNNLAQPDAGSLKSLSLGFEFNSSLASSWVVNLVFVWESPSLPF